MKRTLYVAYDRKKPHLPIAVCDSPTELGKELSKTPNVILNAISQKRGTFAKVEVDWEESDESTLSV